MDLRLLSSLAIFASQVGPSQTSPTYAGNSAEEIDVKGPPNFVDIALGDPIEFPKRAVVDDESVNFSKGRHGQIYGLLCE